MAPRKSIAKQGQLIRTASSMTALGQWIQQSTETLSRATHPLMSQMRSAFPVGGGETAAEAEAAPEQPARQRRGSQVESATLAAALRNRGGAPTKKASTPPGKSAQPGMRHRRATAPVPAAMPAPTSAMREDPIGCVPTPAVPPLPLDRGVGSRVQRYQEHAPTSPQSAAGLGVGGSPQAKQAAAPGLVAQLDEFFHRGTPRARTPRAHGSPSGCPRVPVATRLEQRLANWSRARGLPPGTAPRLVSAEPVAPARSDSGDRSAGSTAREASILWRGVGVDILLEGGLTASTPNNDSGDSPRVASAHTDCGWADARLGVAIAAERAAGMPLETFLDALWQAWQQATNRPEAPIESAGIAMAKGCTGGERHRRATVGTGTDAFTPMAGKGSGRQGAAGRTGSISPASDSMSSFGSSSTRSCTEVGLRPPEGHEAQDDGFREWLSQRPPLWRFDAGSRGLAWDFPPSKAEKRELLLLQLFAEEGERQNQLASLRAALPVALGGSSKGA